jgi:hypothetical protein
VGRELSNGDLVFTGSVIDTLDNGVITPDVWFVKTGSDGCLVPDCGTYQFITNDGVVTSQNEVTLSSNQQIRIFPNPAYTILNISLEESEKTLSVQIFDVLGNEVLRTKTTPWQRELNISSLNPGCYFVKVETFPSVKTIKL